MINNKDLLKDHEGPVFKELMKQLRFYQMFDPDAKKIFNCNVYKLVHLSFILFIQIFNIIIAIGFFSETRNEIDFLDLQVAIFGYINSVLSTLKIIFLMYKADEVKNFIDLTDCDLLMSAQCRKHIHIVHKFRNYSMKVIQFFYTLCMIVIVLWFLFPLVWNHFMMTGDPNQRYQNIYNMPYPISTRNYNQNYFVFFLIEVMIEIFVSYYTGLTDFFVYSCCWITIAQYKMLFEAFKCIGHDWESENFKNSKHHGI